jgi:hypothetical protein
MRLEQQGNKNSLTDSISVYTNTPCMGRPPKTASERVREGIAVCVVSVVPSGSQRLLTKREKGLDHSFFISSIRPSLTR